MQPQWDDLRIFLAVSRHESLSAAGRVLKIDPATVGRRIARLEEALKAPLFAKSPQGYALTGEGQRLAERAARAEQEMTAAFEDLPGRGGRLSGQIRLGSPDGSANFLLPQVCAQIVERNPDLEVQIVALPRVFNLSRREADMAIAVSAPVAGRLSVQKVTDYRLSLVASKEYLRLKGPIRRRQDLRDHRIVGYIQDMIFDKELDYMAEAGLPRVDLASNSVSVQFSWIRQGAGIGIVHDFSIPFGHDMVRILPGDINLLRSFYLIRHVDDRRLDRLNRFAEELASGMRREVARLESLCRDDPRA
ncbi:LysR family transcriptional regulator [Pelagivirga sediminicola]|uniref:LysR family transcriptional regulator n=1 Tax=Pelagivirga sediminicola TaxID=2170575 RepID=A0A2T7GBM9_9RHOB|nr:LysR family transcriptional regulator [Pelagivirga sediminicola]PVA11816.1 LysR family transcriptional regulator [Pelagivirga sediminicola]